MGKQKQTMGKDDLRLDFHQKDGELYLSLYGFDPTLGGATSAKFAVASRTFADFQKEGVIELPALLEMVQDGDKAKISVGERGSKCLNDVGNLIDALEADFNKAVAELQN